MNIDIVNFGEEVRIVILSLSLHKFVLFLSKRYWFVLITFSENATVLI